MNRGVGDRWSVARDRHAEVTEGIVGNRGPDVFLRGRIENRITRVEHAIEARGGDEGAAAGVIDLAVAKTRVVTPAALEEFVAFQLDGGKRGLGLGIVFAIAEIEEPRKIKSGKNLLERIEGIERARGHTGVGVGRTVESRARRVRRDGERRLAGYLERTGGRWREQVVSPDVLIKEITRKRHLIAKDTMGQIDKAAIFFRIRNSGRESVVIKVLCGVGRITVAARRRVSVVQQRRSREKIVAEIRRRIAAGREHRRAR